MTADTGEFRALTAEVERLAALVDSLVQRTIAVEAVYDAGRTAGRQAVLGAPRPARPRRGRPGHLTAVDGTPDGVA